MTKALPSVDSRHLSSRAVKAIPGGALAGFRPPADFPIVVHRGAGALIWSVDGKNWIDYVLGSGPLILGHCHPTVTEAIANQLKRGSTFYALNQAALDLAELLNQTIPCAEQTKFAGSGSEATFYALRIARAATKRECIVKMEGAFHGHHDYAMMSTFSHGPMLPFPRSHIDSAGVPTSLADIEFIVPFNSAEELRKVLRGHRGEVAAVIMEPYQRGIAPQPNYLESVRRITQEEDVLLIFDEIVTGFRLAYGGAQEYYGVTPDLCALGKILGGGLPLAAVCGPERLMKLSSLDAQLDSNFVYFTGTFNGNPLAATAGLATLAELQKPGVYERLFHLGDHMRNGLRRVLMERGAEAVVLGDGPMFHVEYTASPVRNYRESVASNKVRQRRIGEEMIRRGHLWNPVQRNYLSLAHTQDQLDATIAAYSDVVTAELRNELGR